MLEIIFFITTILSILLFYLGTSKNKFALMSFTGYLIIVGCITASGIFISFPKLFIFVILATIILSFTVYKKIEVSRISPKHLILIHCLRIIVEFGLYGLFLQKKIPIFMTFSGWNFDIFIGITAAFFLLANIYKQTIFFVWNILGLILLAIIVVTAIVSSPLPVQLIAFNQPNIAVLEFPYSFLPAIIVPIVALSHVLLLRNIKVSAPHR